MSAVQNDPMMELPMRERLNAVGRGAPNLEEKCQIVQRLREASPEHARRVDRMLVHDRDQLRVALNEADVRLRELKDLLDKVTAPPWHVGVYVCVVEEPESLPCLTESDAPRVLVYHGGSQRVVSLADGLTQALFALGDKVLLNNDLTVVLGHAPADLICVGETAQFDHYTDDGRLVVKSRDEQLVVQACDALRGVDLTAGDLLRWERSAWVAYEKLEQNSGRRYFLNEVPTAGLEQVGGQQRSLRTLLAALQMTLVEPEAAALYS